MANCYVDSSALVKKHINETGSEWMRMICEPISCNAIMTSRITIVEIYSAVYRQKREADITLTDEPIRKLVMNFLI